MSDYRRLLVWRKAHTLALNADRTAARLRGRHRTVFQTQIARAAMSIPANIVEGREQKTEAGFARFLRIALASASELEYHLTAAFDLHAISKSAYQSLATQIAGVRMMLHGLLRRLEPAPTRSHPTTLPGSQ